jgi:hypothetical protein
MLPADVATLQSTGAAGTNGTSVAGIAGTLVGSGAGAAATGSGAGAGAAQAPSTNAFTRKIAPAIRMFLCLVFIFTPKFNLSICFVLPNWERADLVNLISAAS